MNPQAVTLKARAKKFALDVLRLVRSLPRTDETRVIGYQLIKSATGVAANYRATCRSRSDAEFVARINVALEESDESALWLELLTDAGSVSACKTARLLKEADELCAIFAQSSITVNARIERTAAARHIAE